MSSHRVNARIVTVILNTLRKSMLVAAALIATITQAASEVPSWTSYLGSPQSVLRDSLKSRARCTDSFHSVLVQADLTLIAFSNDFYQPARSAHGATYMSQAEYDRHNHPNNIVYNRLSKTECIVSKDATIVFYSLDNSIFRIEVGYADCNVRNNNRPKCHRDMINFTAVDRAIYKEFQHKVAARHSFRHSMVFSQFLSISGLSTLASTLSCTPHWGTAATHDGNWRCLTFATFTNDVWHGIGINELYQRGYIFDRALFHAAGYQEFILVSLHEKSLAYMHDEIRRLAAPHREAAEAEEERKRLLQQQADDLLSRTR